MVKGYDHIISVLVGHNGKLVYLGEQAERPSIYVWETSFDPPILIKTIKQCLKTGIETMALSPSGRYLLATCIDEEVTFTIYDSLNNYALIYCDWLGSSEMCHIDFNTGMPVEKVKIFGTLIHAFWISEQSFIIAGTGEPTIFIDNGESYDRKQFEVSKDDTSIILCAAVIPNGDIVCGTSAGEFLVYRDEAADKGKALSKPKLHSGPLDAICHHNKEYENYVLTGGKDCRFIFLDEDYNIKMSFDIYSLIPYCLDGQIRAITSCVGKKAIALGLICGEIYELTYR